MNQMLRKSAMAAAVAVALGASAQAVATSTILFDRDGTTGGANPISVDTFDWGGDSILLRNFVTSTTSTAKVGGSTVGTEAVSFDPGTTFTFIMQSSLNKFIASNVNNFPANASCLPDGGGGSTCNPVGVSEFTFILNTPLTITSSASADGGTGTNVNWAGGAVADDTAIVGSSFTIYYNTTVATFHNQLAGTNFGSGIKILSGMVMNDNQTNGNFDLNQDPTKLNRLDRSGADNYTGLGTYPGQGNANFDVSVTSQDSNFFVTNLVGSVLPLATLIQSAGGPQTPFNNTDPSAKLDGVTPNYGNNNGQDKVTGVFANNAGTTTRQMDDYHCGIVTANGLPGGTPKAGTTKCDVQAQGQGQTSFSPEQVPEPGSLALLGLGFGVLGYLGRKRRSLRAI